MFRLYKTSGVFLPLSSNLMKKKTKGIWTPTLPPSTQSSTTEPSRQEPKLCYLISIKTETFSSPNHPISVFYKRYMWFTIPSHKLYHQTTGTVGVWAPSEIYNTCQFFPTLFPQIKNPLDEIKLMTSSIIISSPQFYHHTIGTHYCFSVIVTMTLTSFFSWKKHWS